MCIMVLEVVVVALWLEWSLLISESHSSNPTIQNASINKIIGDMVKTKFVLKRFIKLGLRSLFEQKPKGKFDINKKLF